MQYFVTMTNTIFFSDDYNWFRISYWSTDIFTNIVAKCNENVFQLAPVSYGDYSNTDIYETTRFNLKFATRSSYFTTPGTIVPIAFNNKKLSKCDKFHYSSEFLHDKIRMTNDTGSST